MGRVSATDQVTEVKIRAVSTGARVVARIRTEEGRVVHDGDAAIDGVPGTAAPVELLIMDVVGGSTGAMFPAGNRVDEIDGIAVICMDVAIPTVIARAEDFGLSGAETATDLDARPDFHARMEPIRRKAGALMGLGDVSDAVTPKFGLVAPPKAGGDALVPCFIPWNCHPTLAVTGCQCLAACLLAPATVAEGPVQARDRGPHRLRLEHPMGILEVVVDHRREGETFELCSAGLTRTARKIAEGKVFVPRRVWDGGDRA